MSAQLIAMYRLVLCALVASSCSLLVDDRADQCRSNGDCVGFAGTTCDLTTRTCRHTGAASSDGSAALSSAPVPTPDAGAAPGNAEAPRGSADASCPLPMDLPNPNSCTNARCRPFDNLARLPKMTRDGGLPTLPPIRDAGAGGHS